MVSSTSLRALADGRVYRALSPQGDPAIPLVCCPAIASPPAVRPRLCLDLVRLVHLAPRTHDRHAATGSGVVRTLLPRVASGPLVGASGVRARQMRNPL